MKNACPFVCRVVGLLGLLAFVVTAFTPAPRLIHRAMTSPSEERHADAIVVLGASVSPEGLLDSASLRRTLAGVRAQRRGLAPVLLLLGPRHGNAVEADVRSALATDLGVPKEAIRTEPRALTTQQEARRAADLLLPQGARRVLLVTSEYHIRRARALFERAGFEVAPLAVPEIDAASNRPEERLSTMRSALSEAFARGLYRVLGRV
jgi:uncharacterized SAM-binding protein YcdF (DUF218 family)